MIQPTRSSTESRSARRAPFVVATIIALATLSFGHQVWGQSIGLNFTGSSIAQSGFVPPDTMGTVGPNHIVEMINGRYAVYDKTSGVELTSSSLNAFWAAAGAPHAGSFSFDPRVQYDPSSSRYYATSVDNARNPNNILFAVSSSDNPLEGWTGFSIDSDTDNVQWADFPQMGFSNDSVVISNNMFGVSGGPFEINVLVIPKADLLGATPTIANATLLETQRANSGFTSSLQPIMDLDNSGQPMRLFSTEFGAAGGEVFAIQLDGTPNAPLVNNIPDVTGLTAYNAAPLANQPGPKVDLQSGGDRTNSAVKLIGGYYYGIHGVEDPGSGNAALRWYKIDASSMLLEDEGLIADSDLNLIYSSIAANQFGDIVIGCTAVGEQQFASAYAVVGLVNANGDIEFGNLMLLKSGLSDYQTLDGSGRNRWGDYSATVLDPDNPYHFWTFQEFVSAEDQWSIQITEIIIPVSVLPEGRKLNDGVKAAGQLSDVFASDDVYYELDPSPTTNLLKQKIHLILQSTSSTSAPSEFKFRLESAMMGGPSGDVIQTIELLNYNTGKLELLDTRAVANSDESILVTPVGDPSRFVQPITNEVSAEIIWKSESFSGVPFTWSIDVDEAIWLVTD